MTVIGADAVERAARAGEPLRVAASDLMTPLARERARDLGVGIVVGAAALTDRDTAAPLIPAGDGPPQPPGAPVPRALRPARAAPRASVLGSATPADRPAPHPGPPDPGSPHPGSPDRSVGPAVRLGPATPFVGPPSGALYRRGAPVTRTGSTTSTAVGPVTGARTAGAGRVVVVGAGHVGTIAAMRLADADLFDEIVLVDIDEGRAAGIALDLTHTAALSGFATGIRGVGTVEAAGPADYVIVTAGRPRQPGMSRSDLINTNAAIVGDVAARVAATSPQAVLLIVTNPLDEMTHHAWQVSGFPSSRVIGMAGVLDTARFQALVAQDGGARADRITAWALGSHGEEMVIPLSQAGTDGHPLDRLGLAQAVDRARGSGAEVVGLLKTGSAFLAPGTSAARMVLAMTRDSGDVLPAAVLADGSYGIRDVYVGLPARLGRRGVIGIVELPLRPDELTALRAAADRIRERLAGLARAS